MESREHRAGKLLLLACVISFVCFFGSYMRIPIVPLFATSLGADTAQVGLINSAFMLMAGALSIPSGLVSDRLGRRIPLLGGLILLAGSSFLLYWSRTPLQMGGIYLLFGIGLSAFSPTLMSYVADVTPPEVLGQAYGWYTMALYGGMTLGPAAGGFLGTALGLRPVFLVAGGLIFAMFVVALIFLPAPSTDQARGAVRPAILPALTGLMHNRRLIACLVATLGTCFGFGMFVTFMPLYIRSQGMHSGHVGFVFAAQALANAISRLPSGKLSDRVDDRSILVIGGLAVFALALASFGLCRSVVPLMGAAAVMGISMGVAFTAVCALIADVVPREQRGLAMGCYNTCVYVGMMLCAAGMGALIREEGFRIGFFLNGVVGVATLLLFVTLYRRPEPTAA
ncbi:MFS transporter [Geobacter hydrogenophilus]|uniref:MFS transporter n=1 Tax=Geobacter hydrogenophilus TaxID=40983 RepID=A0A9W6G325_9BACT|nr:MFS transporter [Geobacter hydrogenophilus]MBT0892686.1 MFS transporter [Geobacter hydrogenophilus]GLI40084.1 MFS transporter [Geobacter hydrogenophilus]